MPKRKTVSLNCQKTIELIHAHSWSAASYAKMIGKHSRWLSEVNRGRNLPSPEEAARMCAILQVTPEEILTEPEDIAMVQGLIDSQKQEQKEKPAPIRDEPDKEALLNYIDGLDESGLLDVLARVTKRLQEKK